MAANSSVHPARAGYNQSGGAYFVCVSRLTSASGVGTTAVTPATASPLVNDSVAPTTAADPTFLYKISTAAANSGGAFQQATLVPATALEVLGAGTFTGATAAAEFAAGKLIKDMGKTIVSGGRTFRKFAVAATGSRYVDSRGVAGGAAVAPGAGYGTFYLDVGREGATGTTIPAPIARYA
jgi:hypothetical protein